MTDDQRAELHRFIHVLMELDQFLANSGLKVGYLREAVRGLLAALGGILVILDSQPIK